MAHRNLAEVVKKADSPDSDNGAGEEPHRGSSVSWWITSHLALAQPVLHFLHTDFDFQYLTAVRRGKPKRCPRARDLARMITSRLRQVPLIEGIWQPSSL
jgi:hypothetical protein